MKQILILFCALFLMACGESRKQQPSEVDENEMLKSYEEQQRAIFDSVYKDKIDSMNNIIRNYVDKHVMPIEKFDEYMRGYDPASEDDMDDNGMSRYMENDDEEGWD